MYKTEWVFPASFFNMTPFTEFVKERSQTWFHNFQTPQLSQGFRENRRMLPSPPMSNERFSNITSYRNVKCISALRILKQRTATRLTSKKGKVTAARSLIPTRKSVRAELPITPMVRAASLGLAFAPRVK